MRSIMITGARSGLGLQLVKSLLNHETAKPEILIATCRKIADASELQQLASKDKTLHILELELTQFEKYQDFAKEVSGIVGDKGLNVLFHNAGMLISKETDINMVNADKLVEIFKVNSVSPLMLTQALLPLLSNAAKANSSKPLGVDRAAVICMSSILGSVSLNTTGGYWGYRESKAAANMALRSMHKEFEGRGIATLVLHPGWVRTKMGGSSAPLSVEESINGLLPIILNLSPTSNGGFYQYDGKSVSW